MSFKNLLFKKITIKAKSFQNKIQQFLICKELKFCSALLININTSKNSIIVIVDNHYDTDNY